MPSPRAEEPLEQRGLPGAVRADQSHVLATVDRQRHVVEQVLVTRRERKVIDLGDHLPAARRVQELEAEPLPTAGEQRELVGGDRLLLLQPPDVRELRLRLLRLRLLVPEAIHEPLQPRDVGVVALDRLRRVERTRGLLAPPHVPLAREVGRPSGLELEHRGRHRLEEPAVVGDEDHRCVEPDERPLEPLEPLDVEMVRRLVEQQQVGIARQRPRQRRARQLAAGERRELPVELRVLEPEPAERRERVLAPGVPARVLEPSLRSRVARKRLLPVVAGRHRRLQPPELLLEVDQVARARERVLAQRQAEIERRPLVVQRDPRSLVEDDLPRVVAGLAGEHPQQRRLARAVRAGQRQALAPLDLERDVVEEEPARELLAQLGSDHDGHCRRSG